MKYFLICLAVGLIVAVSPERAAAGHSGGRAVQTLHNRWADEDDLTRLKDLTELKKFIAQGHLVEISGIGKAYKLGRIGGYDPKHARWYRYARGYTRDFLDIELGALHAELRYRFKLDSFVRTEWYQKQLCKKVSVKKRHGKKKKQKERGAICGKAGWQRSLHLTGAAFDISMKGMPRRVKTRLIELLIEREDQGMIGFIIERKSNDIHVFVRKVYGVYAEAHKAKKAEKASKKKKPRKKRKSRKHH